MRYKKIRGEERSYVSVMAVVVAEHVFFADQAARSSPLKKEKIGD
jgi:hypothetical protein